MQEGATATPENDEINLIVETLSGQYAGFIGTHHAERRTGTFEYGLAIASRFTRRGYASEAITIVLRYYFEELRYQKVTAGVYSFNTASINLHKRLGFQQEARLRRMVFSHGQYHDLLFFGMTDDEFRAQFSGS